MVGAEPGKNAKPAGNRSVVADGEVYVRADGKKVRRVRIVTPSPSASLAETLTPKATQATAAATANSSEMSPAAQLPKCVCNWVSCRAYQKAFREIKNPLWSGVIKLNFSRNSPKSMVLKWYIDRVLHVCVSKSNGWRAEQVGGKADHISYYVACHHYTEELLQQFLQNLCDWDRHEPLSMPEACFPLYSVDGAVVYNIPLGYGDGDADADARFLRSPNVPKERVRELLRRLKTNRQQSNDIAADSARQSEVIALHQQDITSLAIQLFESKFANRLNQVGKTLPDGSIYFGSWMYGVPHGRSGKCVLPDGSEYEGNFREGKFHGDGKMTMPDGGWYFGSWDDGKKRWQGQEFYADGSLRHGDERESGQHNKFESPQPTVSGSQEVKQPKSYDGTKCQKEKKLAKKQSNKGSEATKPTIKKRDKFGIKWAMEIVITILLCVLVWFVQFDGMAPSRMFLRGEANLARKD